LRRGLEFAHFILVAGLCSVAGFAQSPARHETKQASADQQYLITGAVISSKDGDPVPHCHLTATVAPREGGGNRQFPSPRGNNRQVSNLANGSNCDARGRFTVAVPSAGSWRLTATARGFVSQDYDAHEGFFSSIVLTPDAPTKEIEFRMSPEASIIGVVLDEAGEAIRNAQISLQSVPPKNPGGITPPGNMRGGARTDDRGMYELANLAPGEYRVSVRAQPWYSTTMQAVGGNIGTSSQAAALDPSLDFAYPLTWFPGVSDATAAETIKLHAGDTRQADFNLIPIPSIHLRVLAPPRPAVAPNTAPQQAIPLIQRIAPGEGGQGFAQTSMHFDGQGQVDIGGLTPGLYQVRLAGPNQEGHSAVVEVTANSTRTLDLNTPSHDLARITVRIDGINGDSDSNSRPERGGGLQVTLIDTDTHRGSFSSNRNGEMGLTPVRREQQKEQPSERIIEAPPGRYEVVLQGRPNVFLTGLTAKGAETAGRYITVGAGESTLTVHAASGRASLGGIATIDGKPSAGAMVLLVPITIEDPNSITMLRQDQTNTDGSFDVANIIPGQYILVAIDHGWEVNWGDASTLRRYLMQGVPVDLKPSAIVKQNVTAQTP
jgi:Carboxypeptidase regulatory-like domain